MQLIRLLAALAVLAVCLLPKCSCFETAAFAGASASVRAHYYRYDLGIKKIVGLHNLKSGVTSALYNSRPKPFSKMRVRKSGLLLRASSPSNKDLLDEWKRDFKFSDVKDVASREQGKKEHVFDVNTAVFCAGFAFEAYNEPSDNDARWERGADGCDVAFISHDFACECYQGRLQVRLCEAEELPPPAATSGMAQALLTGSDPDAYVVFALNEEAPAGPKEGAMGLVRAVDRARSATVWSRDQKKEQKKGCVSWGPDECHTLYIKDPNLAQLAFTVFDEEIMKADEPLGAASVKIEDLLKFNGTDTERTWTGWVPLSWRPSETVDNAKMIGAMAGMWMGGPLGAAAGGFVGSLIKKGVQGKVKLEIKYIPMTRLLGSSSFPSSSFSSSSGNFTLSNRAAPKGATDGIDWSLLSR